MKVFVYERSSLTQKKKDRLTTESNVLLAIGKGNSELKTSTSSLVGFAQDVKASAVETKRDLKKAQKTLAVLASHKKAFAEKVSSVTENLSSVRVERTYLCVGLDLMTTLVQRIKKNVGQSFSNASMGVSKDL